MKNLNRNTAKNELYPIRILQFGEGNFLRAFVDWIIFKMNKTGHYDSGVAVVQPIAQGMVDKIAEQDGLYHLVLKGIEQGNPTRTIELIDTVSTVVNPYADYNRYCELALLPNLRFIISNTTEAGITFNGQDKFEDEPANTYPGKITKLLYDRYTYFEGAKDKSLIIIPCELIDRNGDNLRKCVKQYIDLWQLGGDFEQWALEDTIYCNTLVDRIVPGFPRETINDIQDEIGYTDNLVVEGEIFHLWVIEAPEIVQREFPADKAGLNVLFVPSMKPYRDRKVTLLNGPHTVLSPVGYLYGLDTVRECVEDPTIGKFVRRVMFDELLPTLDLPENELKAFADDVIDRFRNPYVKHYVTSIMLNSFSKFKSRDLPGLKRYFERKGILPLGLVYGLAAIVVYYKGGDRQGTPIVPQDDAAVIELLTRLWESQNTETVARGVLGYAELWGEDLNGIPGLTELLTRDLNEILDKGISGSIQQIL